MSQNFFIFSGEKSGDLLGSALIKSLKETLPEWTFSGVAGPEMRKTGINTIINQEEFEVMGFSDVLWSLPKLKKQFNQVRNYILKTNPEVTILIDYPGFNLRLAKALREAGYSGKLVQYISPTVWAWGQNRKEKMIQTLDLLLTIYPFEKKHFANSGLKVEYVGSPIKEIVSKHNYDENWHQLFGIKDPSHLIALFPGSRKSEIQLNLPYQLKAAQMLKQDDPKLTFAISCAHDKMMPVVNDLLSENQLKLNKDVFLLPKGYSYELMRDARSAIAKSGTVTLELALHKRPTVVMYKLTWLNRLIAKFALKLKLPYYCIVNILSEEQAFPELIEEKVSADKLYRLAKEINNETDLRNQCIKTLNRLPKVLKDHQTSSQAAQAIKELASSTTPP